MLTRSRSGSTIIPYGIAGLLSVTLLLSGCGGGSGGGSGGGTSSFSVARGIAADSGGNVYITGDTDGTLGDTSAGDYDMFVIKRTQGMARSGYNSSGPPYMRRRRGLPSTMGETSTLPAIRITIRRIPQALAIASCWSSLTAAEPVSGNGSSARMGTREPMRCPPITAGMCSYRDLRGTVSTALRMPGDRTCS